MKKALLLVSVLFISVMTTACINNLAVQELNNKAKAFMEAGDYPSAIERLKSSIDLDASSYETHYNLAVAYTKAEDYPNAIKVYNDVIKLNPDFADAYYSLAVCEENLATDIYNKILTLDENRNLTKVELTENEELPSKDEFSENNINYMKELWNSSIKHYELYLKKNATAADTEEVKSKVEELKLSIEELTIQEAK